MPDFRVDDNQHAKDESRRAGLAAMGLWTLAGSYCMSPAALTDGWVPEWWVQSWAGRKSAAALVNAGIWVESTRDGAPGYQFVKWTNQRSAADIEAERTDARERMRRLRHGRNGSPEQQSNVRANNTRTFGRSSADVHDTLTLTPTVQGGGVSPVGRYARGTEYPPPKTAQPGENRPPDRCAQHADTDGDPGPCRACGDARRAVEAWTAETARFDAQARSTEARQRAEDRARAIANCGLCNDHGYIGRQLCDHDPDGPERAARGRAAVQAVLNGRTDTSDPP